MSSRAELRSRVEAKAKQLEADLAKARADAHTKSNETAAVIESKLEELRSSLRSGWDNVSDDVAAKLNEWLKD